MATEFGLSIVSPSKSIASEKSTAVTLPGSQGYMTILPDHSAMVAELGIGEMIVTNATTKEKESFFISGGFVEVRGDDVVVLADIVESQKEIQLEAAEEARKEALLALEGKKDQGDIDKSTKALKEAEYRIKVAKSVAS
ncbi:ATP synthase F1 subunit epsilon [Pseudobacteriovorax antillogorgiicola]|uniref:ATP synthase epsilon chain n=1 Tax=Pseudobacteriovorax antillogorgiicola TaxID=1513793 RepID=A0A1Y6B488_9BACT|nr:ATP synthase F1 subunit epsilon [Pseudobacteriovorax antillogorgiicola]TCS59159.1 ATP synthase F1 subcomplex epsilon subunit [Pseudobacteriovorax antillogorgiicola]SME91109.1 ATP synthase F1 subcomplex epsilon subunit [Pseudobacteriovorax antillogorgiicola]